MNPVEQAIRQVNFTRYRRGQTGGHYESFFQRANHPTRPLAFWIRYTLFSPDRRPDDALGELWAVYFDGETGHHVAVKKEVPFGQCTFKTAEFSIRIDGAHLGPGRLVGFATGRERQLAWDLSFQGEAEPLFLLPLELYTRKLPRAKSLVALPMATFNGWLTTDGRRVEVANWVGSQNHNWGSRHTDHYAWGQVAGFDTHPESFLEVATARLKFGPVWTPPMTPIVLRHRGREIRLNQLCQTLRARARLDYFEWRFASGTEDLHIEGRITAAKETFVGLRYYNPPGGIKHCLNSKLAACELTLSEKGRGAAATPEHLATAHRAAFEILTDDVSHGVPLAV